jgi:hypothetical protein
MVSKYVVRFLTTIFVVLQWSLVLAAEGMPSSSNSSSSLTGTNSTQSQNGANSTKSAANAKSAEEKAKERAHTNRERDMNWAMVRALVYLWVALLFFLSFILGALVLVRYIRTIGALSLNNQAYFTTVWRPWGQLKKHFLFAPLFHKRHHRAFMLTRRIDNGCLPSRPQMFILLSYFGVLVTLTFTNIDYTQERRQMLDALTKRTGILALINMVPLFVLAARNNPLIWWTGISFDTYNLFHRWLGRFVFLEVIAHATTYLVQKVAREGWKGYRDTLTNPKKWFVRSGTIVSVHCEW